MAIDVKKSLKNKKTRNKMINLFGKEDEFRRYDLTKDLYRTMNHMKSVTGIKVKFRLFTKKNIESNYDRKSGVLYVNPRDIKKIQ